jgi:hypothetical protein
LNISLYYSRKRRYLAGIDWVVGALHQASLRRGGSGAVSQAVLQLENGLDEVKLRAALDTVGQRFPLIFGKFARDWLNLAPYWSVPKNAAAFSIPLKIVEAADEADAHRILAEHINTPFDSESRHLRFILVRVGSLPLYSGGGLGRGPDTQANVQTPTPALPLSTRGGSLQESATGNTASAKAFLGLMFDHRLFDAFGAESFFRLLDETFQGRLDEIAPKIAVTEPAHLDQWKRRFTSGRQLNRKLIEMQKEAEICAMPMPPAEQHDHVHFIHAPLTAEESTKLNQRALTEISVPILLPSAAARAVRAFNIAVPDPPLAGSQYLIFTSTNLRLPGRDWESLFFNHFSFLTLTVPRTIAQQISASAISLRDQLFQLMKDRLPWALQDAAALGRIFPRPLVAHVINSMFKNRMCSFYFVCLKDTGYSSQTFMGVPALNLFHTPAAFVPPGMNLCMTYFAGRFNLVLSYVEGVLTESQAVQFLNEFKASLVID